MALSQDVFDFLRELKENNNREWFEKHKQRHLDAKEQIEYLIKELIIGFSEFDPHIHQDISPKKCLFRIYRDIRFSKDKTPYKTWYSAGISVDGRKLEGPEYYIHIEPESSYLAVGYWRPKKEHLAEIRQEIDYNGKELEKALKQGGFSLEDLGVYDKLKRAPAGYTEENEYIEVLKLKSLILNVEIGDGMLLSKDASRQIIDEYFRMYPFKQFIHQAIGQ